MGMGKFLRAALAAGLSVFAGTASAASPDGADLQKRFIEAISDAAVPTPAKIDDRLVPIRRDNPALRWENDSPDARVKVVSWMSEDAFQRYYSQPEDLPADKSAPPTWGTMMWVTAVPQVRDFCRALGTRDNAAITNRLLQLIGLPPTGKNARFVEMWVSPKDMMRPCPDREVDDNRCEVDAASDVDDYRAWFTGNFAKSYSVSGAPWTRLGYTYDWAPASDTANPHKPKGVSEFILKPGAPYTISGRFTTLEYCGRPPR
jgi:hypothetical protein